MLFSHGFIPRPRDLRTQAVEEKVGVSSEWLSEQRREGPPGATLHGVLLWPLRGADQARAGRREAHLSPQTHSHPSLPPKSRDGHGLKRLPSRGWSPHSLRCQHPPDALVLQERSCPAFTRCSLTCPSEACVDARPSAAGAVCGVCCRFRACLACHLVGRGGPAFGSKGTGAGVLREGPGRTHSPGELGPNQCIASGLGCRQLSGALSSCDHRRERRGTSSTGTGHQFQSTSFMDVKKVLNTNEL